MQRTTAGFLDNEPVGVFALVMCLLFFAKATKSGKFSDGLLSGAFLGLTRLKLGGCLIYVGNPTICGSFNLSR